MNSGIFLAEVVKMHPESYSADIVFLDSGWPVPGVQIGCNMASSDSGNVDLHWPSEPAGGGDYMDITRKREREVLAVVAMYDQSPIILCFLPPQVCQLLFTEREFKVSRHASDLYSTTDQAANYELYHPSGTYFRIGETPEHRDLTGADFDKIWKITKNTAKAVHVHLEVFNAGVKKATIDIAPNGNITLDSRGSLTAHADGAIAVSTNASASVTASGAVSVSSGVSIQLTAPIINLN